MWIAYVLVLTAVSMDLRSMKISNRLIFFGIIVSLIRRFFCEGVEGLFTGIFLISIPVILFYLLFLAGALGAGDIKLFSMIGGFVNLKKLMWCIVSAFIFGAVFSFFKMVHKGIFLSSIKHAGEYFYDLLQGKRYRYEPESVENGRIHFSLAILLGFLIAEICLR